MTDAYLENYANPVPCKYCGGAVESFYRRPVCTACRARQAALRAARRIAEAGGKLRPLTTEELRRYPR